MSTPANSAIAYFARTWFRERDEVFGIKQADRLSHMYLIGKTGTGKSTLLETLILQDLALGNGLALLDPHGDLAERLVAQIPEHRRDDLIYFDVPDPAQPYGHNPLRAVREDKRSLSAAGLLEVFKQQWREAWGVRMEHILRNAIHALLYLSDATLPDVLRLLTDRSFRSRVIPRVANQQVREFWQHEYPNYSYRLRADGIAPIQNKIGAFLADPLLYRIVTTPERPLRFRQVMDEGKVLIVNLAKGRLGEDTSALLGGLLVTTLALAAFSRAELPQAERRHFFLYADEFQSFTTLSIASMASELRKYGVGLVLAHQYLYQLDEAVRYAVLGNAGTLISFRLGAKDAPFFAREFQPAFGEEDLLTLPNYHIYLKLMIDGSPSRPFSARTLAPAEPFHSDGVG